MYDIGFTVSCLCNSTCVDYSVHCMGVYNASEPEQSTAEAGARQTRPGAGPHQDRQTDGESTV